MSDEAGRTERFWSRVKKGDPGDCWPWQGALQRNGYGTVFFGSRQVGTHRLALILSSGREQREQVAMHSCDNRACCNPSHLSWGSYQDNTDDMRRKGRAPVGERQGGAKLTAERVAEIRRLVSDGLSHGEIAKRYGVSRQTVGNAASGRLWKHI